MKTLETIDHDVLIELTQNDYDACVSLYMPIKRAGAEARQNQVLFRQLCQAVEQKMTRYKVDNKLKDALLASLQTLESEDSLWQNRTEGLAIFAAQDDIYIFHAPMAFTAHAFVDRRFYIRPLLPLLHRQGALSLVLLNQEGARLLSCHGKGCEEVLPPQHLRSLQNYLGMHEFDKSLQFRSNASPAAHTDGGGYAPAYHGQGAAGDSAQANKYLEDYYHHFKNWLLKEGKLPHRVYLAADAHNEGLFRKAADGLPIEIVTLIKKNVRHMEDREIFAAVQAELENTSLHENEEAYDSLPQVEDAVMHSPAQIVKAAHEKRIRTLFLPESDNQLWGWFDHKKHQTIVENSSDVMVGEELYNLAAIRTLQTGGTVIVRAGDQMKTTAVCRW